MKKLFILTLLGLCAVGASAQNPLSFYASQEGSYDDNIYLVNEDVLKDITNPALGKNKKTSSGISTTTVGVDYSATIPETSLALALNGKAAYNAYSEDPGRNSYFDGLASASFGNSIFNVSDTFMYTSDPANSELTDRAKRIKNAADILVKTSANKPIGIGFFAGDVLDKYLDDEFETLSRNSVNGGVRLYYNVSSKTNLFAEYMHIATAYDKKQDPDTGIERDSSTDSIGVGINGQIAPKVTGSAKVSVDNRSYDKDLAGTDSKPSTVGYNLMLTWQPSTQNAITLEGERKMEETLFGNNRYYVTTGVSLTVMQKIFDKWEASLTAGYENMAYQEENPSTWTTYASEKRTDNIVKIRPALDYKFQQWLSAGIWYQYKSRSSNQDFDYNSNKAGAYLKVMF